MFILVLVSYLADSMITLKLIILSLVEAYSFVIGSLVEAYSFVIGSLVEAYSFVIV